MWLQTWLEDSGYRFDVCADVDLHRGDPHLTAYKAVIPKRRFLWNGSQLSWIHRHGSPPYAGSL